jgi:hypothetical protein
MSYGVVQSTDGETDQKFLIGDDPFQRNFPTPKKTFSKPKAA